MAGTLVVTFDLSEFGEHVLETAVPMALAMDADVHLLHVIHPSHETGRAERGYDPLAETQAAALMGRGADIRVRQVETTTQASERLQYEALDYLNRIAARFPSGKTQAVTRSGAHPAHEIVKYADDVNATGIVMATHGRSALAHVVLGSVAAAVVRSSHIPVILKRPSALPKHPDDVNPPAE